MLKTPPSSNTHPGKAVGQLIRSSITPRIEHNASAADALDLMYRYKTQYVAVMDRGDLVGIFTYASYLGNVLRSGKEAENTPLDEVMNTAPAPVDAEQSCRDVFQTVCQNGFPYVPVEQNCRFLGLVSDDILRLELSRELNAMRKKIGFSFFSPDDGSAMGGARP